MNIFCDKTFLLVPRSRSSVNVKFEYNCFFTNTSCYPCFLSYHRSSRDLCVNLLSHNPEFNRPWKVKYLKMWKREKMLVILLVTFILSSANDLNWTGQIYVI